MVRLLFEGRTGARRSQSGSLNLTPSDKESARKFRARPAGVSGDAGRRVHFERQARTVATLNHPDIVTLHSVVDDGTVRFLTMELAEAGAGLDLPQAEEGEQGHAVGLDGQGGLVPPGRS
jgi:hypothetical protein